MAKTKKHREPWYKLERGYDRTLNTAIWAMILFGTAMIISTAVGQTTSNASAVVTSLVKQAFFVFAAWALMLFCDRIVRMRWFIVLQNALIIAFLAVMILPFFFPAVGGSHAWINLGFMTVQPSEFGKPLLIFLCAAAVAQARTDPSMTESWMALFRRPFFAWACTVLLLVFQKDYGTLAITSGIFYFCTMIPSYPKVRKTQRKITLALAALAFVGIILVFTDLGSSILSRFDATAHIAARIENMKNPYTDIYGEGYQPANSLYGIADSGIFGRGFGNSARKYGYLTQADNDYILAVVIEELGIFGLAFLILCYGAIELQLFRYALKTRVSYYKIILAGTGAYIFLHFFLNVGGVGALIPMTGVPLLFISSGGSSLMAVCIALGYSQQCISRIRRREMAPAREKERRVFHERSHLRHI